MRVGSSSSSPRVRPSSSTWRSSDQPALLQQHVAHQRVAVGVQPAGAPSRPARRPAGPAPGRAGRSASTTPVVEPATSYSSGPSSPGCSAVSPPSSAQPATTQASAMPLTIGGDPLRDDLAAGDVVGHEQRLGAADDEVVDEHADQVEADRVVLVELPGRSPPWCRRRRRWSRAAGVGTAQRGRVEQAGEAADAADDLGPPGLVDPLPHQRDGAVARLDRAPPASLRTTGRASWSMPRVTAASRGQGRVRASAAPPPLERRRPGRRRRVARPARARAGACRAAAARAASIG